MKHNQNNIETLLREMDRDIEKDMKEQVTLIFYSSWNTKNEIRLYAPIFDNMGGMFGGIL